MRWTTANCPSGDERHSRLPQRWLTLRVGIGTLPVGMTMLHLAVPGAVAGVGLTMALFIAQLDDPLDLGLAWRLRVVEGASDPRGFGSPPVGQAGLVAADIHEAAATNLHER